MPLVIQWNKRDMPDAMPIEELEAKINWLGVPTTEAVAVAGTGVMPTLKKLSTLVLAKVNSELGGGAPPMASASVRPSLAPRPSQPADGGATSPAGAASPVGAQGVARTATAPPRPAVTSPQRPESTRSGVASVTPARPAMPPRPPSAVAQPARPARPPRPASAGASSSGAQPTVAPKSNTFTLMVVLIVVLAVAIVGVYLAIGQ
jgi:hypothetical protein